MALWRSENPERSLQLIDAFGKKFRSARQQAGVSQMRLEALSGVDQSMISRMELAKAPHASLDRIVCVADALGPFFPLGVCPHEHRCGYRPDWIDPHPERYLPYLRRSGHDDGVVG
jgi:transcriptional regulator with XRE-family HTH domain